MKEKEKKIQTKEKKARKRISNKKVIIGLIIFLLINILAFSFLNAYLTKRMEIEQANPYEEDINRVKDEIKALRSNLDTVKATTSCKPENETEEVKGASVVIDFYQDYTPPIEISQICSDCKIREVGQVLKTSTLPTELSDLKYIVITFDVDPTASMWGETKYVARLLVNDDYSKIYFFENESTFGVETYFNDTLVYNEDYIPTLDTSLLPGDLEIVNYIESDNRIFFSVGYNTYLTPEDTGEISVEDFDSYNGRTIFVDRIDPSLYYIKTKEQFYQKLNFLPSIALDLKWEEPLPITWEGDIENTYSYDYGYDGCSGIGLRTSDIPIEDLQITGYVNNSDAPIYEYLDTEHQDLKKLYEQDYLILPRRINEEGDWEEDLNPMSYEEFIEKHPIIFWEDQTGRLIKFYNHHFLIVGGCAKSVVYLYPQVKTDISVKVLPTSGILTFTYPKYDGVWNVTATRDGLITDRDGNVYNYLWWESKSDHLDTPERGFIVKYENLSPFFDNTLTRAGFIKPEIDDFKEFWIPTMTSEYTPYFKISFLQNKDVDSIARLLINPRPTTEIRLFMIYERMDSYINLPIQEIQQTARNGFIVTEWGGTKR